MVFNHPHHLDTNEDNQLFKCLHSLGEELDGEETRDHEEEDETEKD